MPESYDVILISDRSAFRSMLKEKLSALPAVRLRASIGLADNFLPRIDTHSPHLVVLDVGTPESNSLDALWRILSEAKTPRWTAAPHLLMISDFTPSVAKVMADALEHENFEHMMRSLGPGADQATATQLINRMGALAFEKFGRTILRSHAGSPDREGKRRTTRRLVGTPGGRCAVFIGSSTGGPQALMRLLPALCERISAPILIVQHINANFTKSLAESLDAKCAYKVAEAAHQEVILPRRVYIAPGDRHLLVERKEDNVCSRLSEGPPVDGCRPSTNLLFESGAASYGSGALGLILTGMGADGVQGARAISEKGGTILAQDEASSVIWGMPGSVVAAGLADEVLPLDQMAEAAGDLLGEQEYHS